MRPTFVAVDFLPITMKYLITCILFSSVLNGISYSSSVGLGKIFTSPDGVNPLLPPSEPKNRYFQQKLDHFDKKVKTTWQQRYFSNDKYYESGGPVYLRIADRGALNSQMMSSGYWYSHGKKNRAMFFYISHRYYDEPMPVSTTEIKDLRYLNTNQTLADFAEFIKSKNKEHKFPTGTKWIIFGSSYAASLAAWLRGKYPDLVYGAVASSASVLAKMNFYEYLKTVDIILKKHNEACKNDIAQANKKLDKLVQSKSGREEIGKTFKICDPLDGNQYNISYFTSILTEYITDAIEYDFGHQKTKQICDKMMEGAENKTPIKRLASVITMLMKEQKQDCLPTKVNNYIDFLKATNLFYASFSGRIWLYQVCHEFGWFQTSLPRHNTFSENVNLNYFVYVCSQVFGSSKKSIDDAVAKTNKIFGGLKINTSHTLFINGDSDPRRSAQITSKKDNKNVDVITIKGGSLSSDIFHADSNEDAMRNAIKEIKKKLDSWL